MGIVGFDIQSIDKLPRDPVGHDGVHDSHELIHVFVMEVVRHWDANHFAGVDAQERLDRGRCKDDGA